MKKKALSYFLLLILFLFYNISFAYKVIKKYDPEEYDQQIKAIYTSPSAQSFKLEQRFDYFSNIFIYRPYILYPNGEGPDSRYDEGPLYRTDAFDCMTYVNTVLALIESSNQQNFKKNWLKMNYHEAQPFFIYRFHFTNPDWNKQNEKNSFLKDVTREIFPDDVEVSKTYINRPSWFKNLNENRIRSLVVLNTSQTQERLSELKRMANQLEPTWSIVEYLPLNRLYDKNAKPINAEFEKIPSYSVIELVRPHWHLADKIGTDLDIPHMGFAVRKNGILYFRQASMIEGKVVDTPMKDYLVRYLGKETVEGIHIEQILYNTKSDF